MKSLECMENKAIELHKKLYAQELSEKDYMEEFAEIIYNCSISPEAKTFFERKNIDIMHHPFPANFVVKKAEVKDLQNAVIDTSTLLQKLQDAYKFLSNLEEQASQVDKRITHLYQDIRVPTLQDLLHSNPNVHKTSSNDAKFLTMLLSTNCTSIKLSCQTLAFKYSMFVVGGAQYG